MRETLENVNQPARQVPRGWLQQAAMLALAALLLSALAAPALAQYGSASISATVMDRSGGVVPNAKVVLKNEESGITRETVTNSSGVFVFPSVPPGTYTVAVWNEALPGESRRVTVPDGGDVEVNFTLGRGR